MSSYATKQNRRKLVNAFSDKAALFWAAYLHDECELAIQTSAGRMLLVHSAQVPEKQTKNTAGVNVITLKRNHRITSVRPAEGDGIGGSPSLPGAHTARHGRGAEGRGHGGTNQPCVKFRFSGLLFLCFML